MDNSTRARLEQHIIAAYALRYRTTAPGVFQATPDWARGYSGLQDPTFNVFLPRTLAGLDDDALADASAFFSSRNALYAIELVHDRFPEGPDDLTQRGYESLPPQPAMYLEGIPDELRLNPKVTVELVSTIPALTAFCTLLHQVFDFRLRDMLILHPVAQIREDRIQHYLAFIDDKPVGAGTLICIGGVASIWNVCTHDDYRGQRIASTLLFQLLVDASHKKCPVSMLYSTAQAYHLFNNFGFEIYTQRQWFLPPGIDYEEL